MKTNENKKKEKKITNPHPPPPCLDLKKMTSYTCGPRDAVHRYFKDHDCNVWNFDRFSSEIDEDSTDKPQNIWSRELEKIESLIFTPGLVSKVDGYQHQ